MNRWISWTLKVLLASFTFLHMLPGSTSLTVHAYAFVDVNLISMENESVLPHQTVVVVRDQIVAITPVSKLPLPANVIRINGANAYLIPALTDMHVHLSTEYDLIQYLRYGVTTVRNMNGTPQHLIWRDEIARDERIGPQIVTAGPCVGELPAQWADSSIDVCMNTTVMDQHLAGYDFIKVYDNLPISAHCCLMDAARAYGMDVVGHVPDGMPLADILTSGQRSIEHLEGYGGVPADQLLQIIEETVRNEVWNCPTLTIWQRLHATEGASSAARDALTDYAAHNTRTLLCLPPRCDTQGYTLDPPSAQRLQLVAQLHKAGALLLLGTDAPMLCTVPGFSVHQELQNFVDAGLTPFDALKTATVNPAIFWNQLDERGTVSVGKEADLLLLRANPLDDIRATQEIIGVMVNGEWFASPSCIGQ
jgi:imidazolonepropionase-like amidohydrolase